MLPTVVLGFIEGVFEMSEKLKQSQGNVVTGDRFYDRKKEIELFIKKIEEGAHILLVAQRRMGKTSLMAEAAEQLGNKYICLFVDLQSSRNGPDAIKEITVKMREHMNLWQRAKNLFANVLKDYVEEVNAGEFGIKIRAGLTEATWAGKGDDLFRILAGSEKPVVIFMDEVPILVNYLIKGEEGKITSDGRRRADQFMSWIRKNSIEHQGKLRIVISGSIGLEPVLRQAGLSATVNNFIPFELEAWDEDTAKKCLSALANEYGVKFEEEATSKVVEKLGLCIPHHVQMFFSHIYDRCKRRGDLICTSTDVEEVYKSEMLGVRGHAELTHYEERLERVLGIELSKFAFDMLTEAAVIGRLDRQAIAAFQKEYAQAVTNVADVQKEILQVLEHDGYLKKSREGFVFESRLLRDWWKNRHEAFFTPVLKRGD
jgi:hypothetical protein